MKTPEEMMIAALARQAVELEDENARLREQKLRLVADHADERARRMGLEAEVARGREVVAELRRLLAPVTFGAAAVDAALARANAWLDGRVP